MLSSALTILSDNLCTIAFQLLIYQKKFDTKFSKKFHDILSLIKNTTFRSATIKSKKRQIKFNSVDTHNFFFSSDWIVDKIKIRTVIKQFLKNIVDYRFVLSKETEISALSISAFTENKSLTSQLIHIKKDSSVSDDIFTVWSNIDDICSQNSNTMSDQSESSKNIFFNFEIISEQMQALFDTLTAAMNTKINRLNNELRQLLQTITQQTFAFSSASETNVRRENSKRFFKKWTSKEIEFFDSTTNKIEFVINLEKHVFYKNVYVFVNRLKNVASLRDENILRNIIFQCLRDTTLIWHSTELSNVEKSIYREMSFDNWCTILIKRFKEKTFTALINIHFTKYILDDVRNQKNSKVFAQNIFRHVKIANMTSTYNQLCIIWNNFNWQFRQHISQFKKSTIIQFFLKQLDEQFDIWYEMIVVKKYDYEQFRKFSNKQFNQLSDRDTDRQNVTYTQHSRFSFKTNDAYQNNQNRVERSKMKITIKIENQKEINERDFDKAKQMNTDKRKRNDRSFENDKQEQKRSFDKNEKKKYRDEKLRFKAYVIENDQDFESSDYHQSEELFYFDSNYDFDESDDSEATVLANTIDFVCRRCIKIFVSNNQFHHHLRIANCDKLLKIAIACSNSIVTDVSLIHSTVDSNKNIDTEYDFKEWQYVIAQVNLISEVKSDFDCIDSEAEIILMNEKFFNQKIMNVFIRIMTTSISVKNLKTIKHSTNKYAMLSMYFSETNSADISTKTIIIREVHLIDDLKANLLINNDILDSKQIDIFNSTGTALIDSYDVTISITTRTEVRSQIRSIHALKAITIFSRFKCLVSIHHMFSLFNRDFLFESVEINLTIYTHLVNLKTSFILIRNDRIQSMKIFKNFRLRTIKEFDYSNAYQVDSLNVSELALRHSKFEHKNAWFHKIIAAYNAVTTICHNVIISATNVKSKKILQNEIIIHNFSDIVVRTFVDLINEYFKLWIDKKFANLSMKNWMKISLKSNWKNKITDKVKIYFINTKNRELLNSTFDKFHEQKKLFWTKQSTSFSFSCFVVWRDFVENKKDRVVVDIRSLNAMIQSDAYLVSFQSDILMIVSECHFISIIDCVEFFYQWRVHSADRHKLTVIIHKNQKFFNVTVMSYKNSSTYV